MFGWGVLKHGIPESVRFCIGDLLMYIFWYQPIPSKDNVLADLLSRWQYTVEKCVTT